MRVRDIERLGQLHDEWQCRLDGGRSVVADGHIQRLSDHILQREIGHVVRDPGPEGGHNGWMRQPRVHEPVERGGEGAGLFRRDVEVEGLERHQPVVVRIVGPEDRSEDAYPDLVHDPVGTECTGIGR